jgi:hypothetical protein
VRKIKIRRMYRMSVHPSFRNQMNYNSVGEIGTITSGINLNPQQPITANAGIDDTSKDIQSSIMCENMTFMCNESIY